MPITEDTITLAGPRGPVRAVLARPAQVSAGARSPAVLVLHEGLGLTQHTRSLLGRFAEAGYLALAPNLYSHDEAHAGFSEAEVAQGIRLLREANHDAEVAKLPAEQQAQVRKVFAWFAGRDTSTYLPDAEAALAHLQGAPEVQTNAVVAVGFSLGGGLVGQLALAGAALAGGIIFYGQFGAVERVAEVAFPLQGHYGAADPAVTDQVPALQAALARAAKDFEPYIYAGAGHGFFNESRPTYLPDAAALAWRRSLGFIDRLAGRIGQRKADAA